MSNGVLAFTLGLQASPFLNGIGQARGALSGFLGTAARLTGIGALVGGAFEGLKQSANIVTGVFDAITRGSQLQALHARTGESVRDLFLLQKGFQAVGLPADEVGSMVFRLNRALSGMSELGQSTAVDFSILGLQMSEIRKLDAPAQFEAIAKSMSRLGQSQASAVASKIFGREGAQNFLQLARSAGEFTDAMVRNAAAADQMARNAAAFHKIEISLGVLKDKTQTFFAGIAEGAAPGIQKILNALNQIDLSGIGEKFGHVLAGFGQAIEDHKIGELLGDALEAGIEQGANAVTAFFDGMNAAMQVFFQNLIEQSNITKRALMAFVAIPGGAGQAAVGMVESMMGMKGGKKMTQQGDATMARGIFGGLEAVGEATAGTGAAFAIKFSESLKDAPTEAWKKFQALLGAEAAKVPAGVAEPGAAKTGAIGGSLGKSFDATSLEKMGFIFGKGGPTVIANHQARTAQATERTAQNTGGILAHLAGGAPQTGILPRNY